MIARIEALLTHDVAGDPCTGLTWTRRATRKISKELGALGIGVCYIRTTHTKTGLRVTPHLVTREYPKGVRISDAVMATLDIRPHETQPLRNYTIHPRGYWGGHPG